MSSLRILSVSVALAVFVYMGANAADARVGQVKTAVQSVLTADQPFEWFGEIWIPNDEPLVIQFVADLALMAVLFGGLPLATFGLLVEREWAGERIERRRCPHTPYSCLTFQIVSCGTSTLFLALFIPEFLFHEHSVFDWGFAVVFPGYLALQLVLGIAAIPVWRRWGVMNPCLESSFPTARTPRH